MLKTTKAQLRHSALTMILNGANKEDISRIYTALTGLPLFWRTEIPEQLRTPLDDIIKEEVV